MMSSKPLLSINNLSIAVPVNDQEPLILKDVSLRLERGETLGLVGESGSGKSLTALAIMGLLPPAMKIVKGSIDLTLNDYTHSLLKMSEDERRKLRGRNIAMIFQEPMTSLNPVLKCGVQVGEVLRVHTNLTSNQIREKVIQLFEEVELPRPADIFESYPHQISGGQKQRVMIAMAVACEPDIIIADEPTTALDVTVQNRVLALLSRLCRQRRTGLIFITHDLGVVASIAQRVQVMHKSEVVEEGTVNEILKNPSQEYTKALISCRPKLSGNPHRLPTVADFNRQQPAEGSPMVEKPIKASSKLLEASDISVIYPGKRNWLGRPSSFVHAVNQVSITVNRGETLGLVGESGCGKSTLGRVLIGLLKPQGGRVLFDNTDISELKGEDLRSFRKRAQIIFQDPYSSLNPSKSIQSALLEPMVVHKIKNNRDERAKYLNYVLDRVGLPQSALDKYPHQFSGGQRQRISIARALMVEPEFIVCDESVSALDVSVQAQVLNLLNDLKEEFNLTYVFISHDLAVVKYMSDRLVVMKSGKIEEEGDPFEIYAHPKSEYTRHLIESIPQIA